MAQKQREDKVQPIDKYGASVFYGAGPQQQQPNNFGSFGATYSNGQARPVVPVTPTSAPVARVQPVSGNSNAGNVRNENWSQDQIIFSSETNDTRNSSSWSSSAASLSAPSSGRGDTNGPEYSVEFRRTLDALLNGRASAF